MNRQVTVNISLGTIVKTALLVLGFYLLWIFIDLALVILTAIVVASSIEPLVKKFDKKKIPRFFSVTFIYVVLLSLITVAVLFFIPLVAEQTQSLAREMPIHIENLNSWIDTEISSGNVLSGVFESLKNQISELGLSDGGGVARESSDLISQSIIKIFGGLTSFILILVLSFYFAMQEHGIEKFLKIVTPAKYTKYGINLWKRSQKKIGLWMQGQLVLGILIGVLTYLGLIVFFDFEQALLLAVIAALAELVPMIGPFLAAIPAMSIALLTGGWGTVGGVALFYLAIQVIENQLIYPLVVRKVVGVPVLLVIISLVVGAKLFGFLGVILSIPLAAALMEYIKDIEKKQEAEIKSGQTEEVNLGKKK